MLLRAQVVQYSMRLGGMTGVAKKRKTVEHQYKDSKKSTAHGRDEQEPVLAGDDDDCCRGSKEGEEEEWQEDPLRGHVREVLPDTKLEKAMLWCVCLASLLVYLHMNCAPAL